MTRAVRALGSPRQLWIGAAAVAALSAAANMASPLYPTYQQAYGMSDLTMAMLYATFAISALPALLLFGSAADAFGRRPALLAGLACAALGTALFAADVAGVPGLFLGRVLLGVGLGLGTGAGIALMVEASPIDRPSLGSTAATISFVLGTGLGPMMAGGVAELARDATTAPFVIMLGVLALTATLVGRLHVHRPLTRQRWRPTWPSVPHAMRASFAVAAMTGFLGWAAVGVFLALLPSVAGSLVPGAGLAMTGAVVGSVLLVSALGQLVAPLLESRAAQTIGLTLLSLGIALLLGSYLPGVGERSVLVMLVAAAVATGAGHGLSYWGANRETDVLTPANQRAGVSAGLYLAFYAGAGLPAVGVGLLTLEATLTGAIIAVSLTLLLCAIAFLPVPSLTLTRVRRPRAETVTEAAAPVP